MRTGISHRLPRPDRARTVVRVPPIPEDLGATLTGYRGVGPSLILVTERGVLGFSGHVRRVGLTPKGFVCKGKGSVPYTRVAIGERVSGKGPDRRLRFNL